MKAFAIGVVLGASLCFIVMRVVDRPAPTVPAVAVNEQVAVNEPAAGNEPIAVRSPSPAATLPASSSCPEIKSVERIPASSAPATITNVVRRVSIDDFTDQEAQQICTQMYQRQSQRERDKKDSEPVDAAWAPSMEMLIRQHVESNLTRKQYSQLKLQCRTTFCELELVGTGVDNQRPAQEFVQEIANQPWADSIVNKGGGSNSLGGDSWAVTQEWFRPRTETELRLWRRKPPN